MKFAFEEAVEAVAMSRELNVLKPPDLVQDGS